MIQAEIYCFMPTHICTQTDDIVLTVFHIRQRSFSSFFKREHLFLFTFFVVTEEVCAAFLDCFLVLLRLLLSLLASRSLRTNLNSPPRARRCRPSSEYSQQTWVADQHTLSAAQEIGEKKWIVCSSGSPRASSLSLRTTKNTKKLRKKSQVSTRVKIFFFMLSQE